MKRITINNNTITKENAIKEARKFHKETGKKVEVCNMLGDTILYISNGKEFIY